MAYSPVITTLLEGRQRTLLQYDFTYVDTNASANNLYVSATHNAATPATPDTKMSRIMKIEGMITSAAGSATSTVQLLWKGTSNVVALTLPVNFPFCFHFEKQGGLRNIITLANGRTGDILITTTGLAAGDAVNFIIDVLHS